MMEPEPQQRSRPRPSPIVDWVTEYDNIGFAPDGAAAWFFEQCPILAEKFRQRQRQRRRHRRHHQEQEEEAGGVVDSRVQMKLDVKYGATCGGDSSSSPSSSSGDHGDDNHDDNHYPLQIPPSRPRQRYDILTPAAAAAAESSSSSSCKKKKGIFVFVHGGYWYKADRSWFTHFAGVPLSKGYQVIIPGYTLCPDVRVSDISKEITQFLRHLHQQQQQQHQKQQQFQQQEQAEDEDDGDDDDDDCEIWKDCPIVLCGHSAGGHLVTRQLCQDLASSIPVELLHRVTDIISLSGVHDLRPIVHVTNHNETIQLDDDEARRESPVLATPVIVQTQNANTTATAMTSTAAAATTRSSSKKGQVDENDDDRRHLHHRHHLVVTCMVGGDERPEFIRQTELLGNVWKGMGIATQTIHIPNKHHFNIVDEILDPASTLWTQILV